MWLGKHCTYHHSFLIMIFFCIITIKSDAWPCVHQMHDLVCIVSRKMLHTSYLFLLDYFIFSCVSQYQFDTYYSCEFWFEKYWSCFFFFVCFQSTTNTTCSLIRNIFALSTAICMHQSNHKQAHCISLVKQEYFRTWGTWKALH